jgi:hypothetical protein
VDRELLISPHYRIEIDLTCEPLEENAIISEETIDELISNWEIVRPVSKFANYSELIAPLTDFSGNYYNTYDSSYTASLMSRFTDTLTPSAGGTSIHIQSAASTRWHAYHSLDSRDLIVQVFEANSYDPLEKPFTQIIPSEIHSVANNEVIIDFPNPTQGIVLIKKAEETHTQAAGANPWVFNHNFGDYLISNYFSNTRYKQYPASIVVTNPNTLTTTWTGNETGYGEGAIQQYTHTQAVASDTWTINHNLDVPGVIVQVYDAADNVIIPATFSMTGDNSCQVTFGAAITGTAVVIPIDFFLSKVDVYNATTYWKVGTGGSATFDPVSANDVENELKRGSFTRKFQDSDHYYFEFEARTNDDNDITEMGLFRGDTGDILFYSYFDLIHKPSNTTLIVHYRVSKGDL